MIELRMLPKSWFLHVDGDTIGPLTESVVYALLEKRRLQFSDFGWTEGMANWVRLGELSAFNHLVPSSPSGEIPRTAAAAAQMTPSAKITAGARTETIPARANVVPMHVVKNSKNASHTPVPSRSHRVEIPRMQRVTLDGIITLEDGSRHEILNLSESGIFINLPDDIPIIGTEVRFTLHAKALGKSLDMTGLLVREQIRDGENAVAIEFTRVNPVHRRVLKSYVESKISKS